MALFTFAASIMPSYIMLAVCTPTPSSVSAKGTYFTSAGNQPITPN